MTSFTSMRKILGAKTLDEECLQGCLLDLVCRGTHINFRLQAKSVLE